MHPPDGSVYKMAALRGSRILSKDLSDEDYWASSNASKIKNKGNLFDDSVDLAAAKRLIQNPLLEEEDDEQEDVINWDGSTLATGRIEFSKSARYRPTPPPASLGVGSNVKQHQPESNDVKSQGSGLSIEDAVGSSRRAPPTLTEVSKLESEISSLKRMLDSAQKDRFAKIPVPQTVKRMVNGKPVSLEAYKSKEDKLALLDETIKAHDGNAIIAAVLFLHKTIKTSIFNFELKSRPEAVNHYVNYLRQGEQFNELLDVLGMLGRSEEAGMLKYRQAVSVKNVETKVKNLKNCYSTHFQTDPFLAHEASLIQEQVNLLERQMPVEEADIKAEQSGDPKFRELPRAASILDQPVIVTLYYCCLYHYNLGENSLASPMALRKLHKLTDKQYLWTALSARAKLKRWPDIEALFQTKGWFGGTKMKAVIGFDKVVNQLSKLEAPRDILNKYCSLIEDTERRLEIAHKYNCHESVIETHKQQRDRQALQEYFHKLKPNSQEWFYAQDVLKCSTIKWKN